MWQRPVICDRQIKIPCTSCAKQKICDILCDLSQAE